MNDRPPRRKFRRGADGTDDVDARVREIVDLMVDGKWNSRAYLELSKKHGATGVTVQDWSRQAARIIRFMRGPPEDFRERILANLDFAGRFALELERPDVKAFIQAQTEQARLLRLDREDDATEQLPVEQLAAALRALGHEVTLHESKANSGGDGDDESGDDGAGK